MRFGTNPQPIADIYSVLLAWGVLHMYQPNHFRLDQFADRGRKLTLAKQEFLLIFKESHVSASWRRSPPRYGEHSFRIPVFLRATKRLDLKPRR